MAYSRPDTDQATMHRAVAALHSSQQSRFYLRKSTHLSARRDGGVPGRALLCRRGGSASSRPDAPPRLLISAKWGSSARRRPSATRWMLRPLGPEGRFKPCYCESFCRRKAKAGVARQWKMQADKSTAVYASFCTTGYVPRSRGGSPWQRIAEAGRRTDGGLRQALRSHAMNLAHSAGALKDGHG